MTISRLWAIAVVLALVACKKDDKKDAPKIEAPAVDAAASPPKSTTADAAAAVPSPSPGEATAALEGIEPKQGFGRLGFAATTAPAPASAPAQSTCKAACEHRASCQIGDAAGCVEECAALVDLGTVRDAELQEYVKTPCDQAKQVEPQFQLASACRHACVHRNECVPDASVKECIPDCGALVITAKQDAQTVLAPYIAKDCEAVKADEPIMTCLNACTHALGCGVTGDLEGCLGYCIDRLKQGTSVEQIAAIAKTDCEQVKASVQLPSKGGGGIECTAAGLYEVCDGSFCRRRVADSTAGGTSREAAELAALQSCSGHMTRMIIIENMANTARRKQGCKVTTCS